MKSEALLISVEYVRQALDALVHSAHEAEFNPLQSLQIVQDRLLSDDFTFLANPQQFALNDLLASIIEYEYLYNRRIYGFHDEEKDLSISKVKSFIAEDASTQNAVFIGMSWLYYHYIKTSFHFSQHEFAKLANLDERTIRRYQNSAIEYLVTRLILQEQKARKNILTSRLYAELPHKGKEISIFGREQELKFINQNPNKHLHLMGGAGIGKTTLIEYVLRKKIANGEVDQIVWLDSPPTIEYVKTYLYQSLIDEYSRYTLEEYLLLRHVAIVLDNSEYLFQDIVPLQRLLRECSKAQIFLSTHLFHHPLPECEQIVLKELALASIEMIVDQSLSSNQERQDSDTILEVRNWVGGNPLAIKLFVQYRSLYSAKVANRFAVNYLYNEQFLNLTASVKIAWLLTSLNIDNRLTLNLLTDLELPVLNFQDFITLINLHVIEDHSDYLKVNVSARHFIKNQYLTSYDLQEQLLDLLIYIDLIFGTSKYLCLVLVECILHVDWLLVDRDIKLRIANLLCHYGIQQGHYAQWHLILSEYVNDVAAENLNLLIAYGICLRRLGKLEESSETFISIIEYCGQYGLFEYQGEALLEICILSRYRANYEDASYYLMRVKTVSKTLNSIKLNERILVEEIEFAIETNRWKLAQSKLQNLATNNPRRMMLELEVSVNVYEDTLTNSLLDSLFIHLRSLANDNLPGLARAHVLIGRIYERRSNIRLATKHFVTALSLLEIHDNDPFALARTQSNLAAVLLLSDDLTGISELISAAEYTQRILGDQVGLAVTMHNYNVLMRKIVS